MSWSIFRSEQMSAEVACLDITTFDGSTSSNMCAVGLWDMTAKLINLKDMSTLHTEELGGGETTLRILFF